MHRARILEEASPEEIRSHYTSLEEAMIHRIKQEDEVLANDRF